MHRNENASESWLIGVGDMGTLVRSMDWSKTPLGRWNCGRKACAQRSVCASLPIFRFPSPGSPNTSRSTTTAIGRPAAENIRAPWGRISASAGSLPRRSSGNRLNAPCSGKPPFLKTSECFSTATDTWRRPSSRFPSARSAMKAEGGRAPHSRATRPRGPGGQRAYHQGGFNCRCRFWRSSTWTFPSRYSTRSKPGRKKPGSRPQPRRCPSLLEQVLIKDRSGQTKVPPPF